MGENIAAHHAAQDKASNNPVDIKSLLTKTLQNIQVAVSKNEKAKLEEKEG